MEDFFADEPAGDPRDGEQRAILMEVDADQNKSTWNTAAGIITPAGQPSLGKLLRDFEAEGYESPVESEVTTLSEEGPNPEADKPPGDSASNTANPKLLVPAVPPEKRVPPTTPKNDLPPRQKVDQYRSEVLYSVVGQRTPRTRKSVVVVGQDAPDLPDFMAPAETGPWNQGDPANGSTQGLVVADEDVSARGGPSRRVSFVDEELVEPSGPPSETVYSKTSSAPSDDIPYRRHTSSSDDYTSSSAISSSSVTPGGGLETTSSAAEPESGSEAQAQSSSEKTIISDEEAAFDFLAPDESAPFYTDFLFYPEGGSSSGESSSSSAEEPPPHIVVVEDALEKRARLLRTISQAAQSIEKSVRRSLGE